LLQALQKRDQQNKEFGKKQLKLQEEENESNKEKNLGSRSCRHGNTDAVGDSKGSRHDTRNYRAGSRKFEK
jgi:hypothetical protein